jgi:hypothetical protein
LTDAELQGLAAQALNLARRDYERKNFNFLLASYHQGTALHRMTKVEALIIEKLGEDWLNSGRKKDIGMGLMALATHYKPPDAIMFVTAANMFRQTAKFDKLSRAEQDKIIQAGHDRHHEGVKQGLFELVDSMVSVAQTPERVCNYMLEMKRDAVPVVHFFDQSEFDGRLKMYGRDINKLRRELGI